MFNSKIISAGSYLPKKIVTNFDLSKIVDTSDEWIFERTGIKQRNIAAEGHKKSVHSQSELFIGHIELVLYADTIVL